MPASSRFDESRNRAVIDMQSPDSATTFLLIIAPDEKNVDGRSSRRPESGGRDNETQPVIPFTSTITLIN